MNRFRTLAPWMLILSLIVLAGAGCQREVAEQPINPDPISGVDTGTSAVVDQGT